MSRVIVVVLLAAAAFSNACGPLPSSEGDEFEWVASSVESGEFGIRVLSQAELWDGSCGEFETAQGPPPHFGEIGRTSATIIADCGGPFFGPYARGAVSLQQRGQSRVWHLEAEAISSSEGSASANVNFFDVVSVNSAGPDAESDALVHLKLRVPFVGDIENAPNAEYEGFVRVFLLDPSNGSLQTFFSTSFFYERFEGNQTRTAEVNLPPVPPGTKLFVSTGFLFALSVSFDALTPPKRASVEADFNICPADGSPRAEITMASGAVGDCSTGDLEFVSLEPIQAVEGTNVPAGSSLVDLVEGKPYVIKAIIRSTFQSAVSVLVSFELDRPLAAPVTIQQEVTIPAGCTKVLYFPQTLGASDPESCLPSPSGSSIALPPAGDTLVITGTLEVLDSAVVDETNNEKATRAIPVKETALSIVYLKLGSPLFGRVNDQPFEQQVAIADVDTGAMFPISATGFGSQKCVDSLGYCQVTGDGQRCFRNPDKSVSCPGIEADIDKSYFIGRLFDPSADAYIVVVPRNFFLFYTNGLSYCGLTRKAGRSRALSLVSIQAECVVAATTTHELVHQHQPSGISDEDAHPATQPAGYWPACHSIERRFDSIPSSLFRIEAAGCQIGPFDHNLLTPAPAPAPPVSAPRIWIDPDSFQSILTLRKVRPDPPTLLVAGFADRSDRITASRWHVFETGGKIDALENGPYSISTIAADGHVIDSTSFPLGFGLILDGVDSADTQVVETDTASFGFLIAYPDETALVQIRKGNRLLLEVDPLSKTLRDAILAIPDFGFDKNPHQRRQALLNKVDAIEKMIKNNQRPGAIHALESDLRDKIEKWVVPYAGTLDQLSKGKIIDQIDNTAARLRVQGGTPR